MVPYHSRVQAYAGQLLCKDLVVPSIYTYIKKDMFTLLIKY